MQETYARGNELQVPDCADYFMENLQRLSDTNYIPTKVTSLKLLDVFSLSIQKYACLLYCSDIP